MSALVESLLTACTLSGLAAGCLVLLPRTPPRVRFAVAAAGLAAWLVPWGWLRIALPSEPIAAPLTATFVIAGELASLPIRPWLDAGTLLGYALAAASLIGLALFGGDCWALRRCVRRWRATSRPADGLRSLLPPELAGVPAEIRVVENSNVAAASGYLRADDLDRRPLCGRAPAAHRHPRDVARAQPRSALARSDRGRAPHVLVESAGRLPRSPGDAHDRVDLRSPQRRSTSTSPATSPSSRRCCSPTRHRRRA